MFAIMRISSAVLFHLKGGDHLPCCIQRAFESHLGIPVWDGPGNRVNGGMTHILGRANCG